MMRCLPILFLSFLLTEVASKPVLEPTTLGFCFTEAGKCLDQNGNPPFPTIGDTTRDNLRYRGNPLKGGLMTALECVCSGGVMFHWKGTDTHSDCASISSVDTMDPSGEITGMDVTVTIKGVYELEPSGGSDRRELSLYGTTYEYNWNAVCGSSMVGDPHIKKWGGDWYDWHGECDTVFLHALDFLHGLGLAIHTRTTMRYDYSYIESVAVRIGEDIVEVSSYGEYWYNGVSGAAMPQVMGGSCTVSRTQESKQKHSFKIDLGEGAYILIGTMKDIVSIKVVHGVAPVFNEWFGNSTGLMGAFHGGKTLARDGMTVLEDPNELGQEWQVLDSEPKLFQNTERAPQYPEKCRLPEKGVSQKRRLGATSVSREAAEKACANWNEDEKKNCIKDVLSTNDLELASGGGY